MKLYLNNDDRLRVVNNEAGRNSSGVNVSVEGGKLIVEVYGIYYRGKGRQNKR